MNPWPTIIQTLDIIAVLLAFVLVVLILIGVHLAVILTKLK